MTNLFLLFLNTKNRIVLIDDLFNLIYFFFNMSSKYVLIIFCFSNRVGINGDERIVSCISSITWSYFFLFFDNSLFFDSWKISSTFFIYSEMRSISNSLSSNVIRTLFFFIQSLSRIMSLEIDLIYMVIRYWSFSVLSWLFIHFLRTIFSFVTVLVFVLYLIEMIFSLFFWIHVLNTTIVFVSKSISLSLITILSSSSCMIIERVIRFPSPDSSSFLRLSHFSIHRRLRE